MRASSEGDFAGEFSYSYPLFQQFSKTAAPWGEVFATEVVGPRKLGLNGVSDQRMPDFVVIGSAWSGRLLLVGQLALSLPSLVGAGLFVDTLHNLKSSG